MNFKKFFTKSLKKSYKVNQKQKAGNNSSQIQVGRDYDAK